MAKEIPQILKGFRDYLPQDQAFRRKVINKIAEAFERFGFLPLDTPAIEPYELFQGKIGEDEKLIYRFQDLGEREVALRYDLTVPLVRVISENKDLPKPFKRYQIGSVWRADKPQKGRYREFTQCDIDIVGSDSKLADVEVAAAMYAAYQTLGISDLEVKFNNRQLVDEALGKLKVPKKNVAAFMRTLDKLDKLGEQKIEASLVEQGFERGLLGKYAEQMDILSQDYVRETQQLMKELGVNEARFDKYLMRGQDYYTGIIYEFVLKEKPEYGSIGGGGRYNEMIGKITGVETPAVGASIGLDRLLAALEERGETKNEANIQAIVFNLDEKLIPEYLKLATTLRAAGVSAELYYEPAKLDKQFKYAENRGIQVAVIMGADEAQKQEVNLKRLSDKNQVTVSVNNLVSELQKLLT